MKEIKKNSKNEMKNEMKKEIKLQKLSFIFFLTLLLFFLPPPSGLGVEAWKMACIFLFTIVGIMLQVAPMGVMSMFGMMWAASSTVVAIGDSKRSIEIVLSGFGSPVIWLVIISFFISKGFIKTGLGNRIAYWFLSLFGKTPLGIAYSLNLADLMLAPATPSNTARGGAIIFPVMKSICLNLDSNPETRESRRKIGSYLTMVAYNGNIITSAMFLTSTAANPLAQKFALDLGISLTWGQWFLASIVPGLITLLLMPLFLYFIFPPSLKDASLARGMAIKKLKEIGPLSKNEWMMLLCFAILLVLWTLGSLFGVEPTVAGLIGLSFLLLTSVLTWDDIKSEKGAWDTLMWLSVLIMLGTQLSALGFMSWMTLHFENILSHFGSQSAYPLIVLVYAFCHYFFAGVSAQLVTMYSSFLSLGISMGVPGKPLALMLAMVTSLMGAQTHYGHGPAPLFFGSGYVSLKAWWVNGFFLSIFYLLIFLILGTGWWKIIGIF